ncbi:MAG: ABC transporter permease/substrate-binding protein [Lachnospiraceae bacterium]|nr:MAG: ABC transporter permease/substrate-binding protein [Lachnospiraceae bacterium]
MLTIIQTFHERFADWNLALFEHLQISLLSLLLAVFIAVPLGIILVKLPKLKEWMLQLTGVFQTIPSLALLGLFIPVLGIGKIPAVTALVIYALFPVLQSTITGLDSVDKNLQEAAEAFGMNRLERLRKFELPLAMPVIVSGVRTAAVLIVGTATLGALIGAGGMGSFILLGIDRNNTALILIGAISSAFLAILMNIVIKYLENKSLKKILISLIALITATALSFIPSIAPMMNSRRLLVAGKLGPEPEILINMYKELIEANSDIKVKLEPNFGKTSFLYEALKNKQIDIYPEFSGTITSSLLKNQVQVSNDPLEVYEAAREGILNQDKLVYLKPMEYQNTYALAVKKDYANKYDLKTISDLSKVEDSAVAGFTLEFNDRDDGNKGLKSLYKLELNVKTLEPNLRYQAINGGNVQIVDAYSTDSELIEYDLVVLEDDKQLFPPYQGAPLMRKDTLEKYPELEEILNKLAGQISAEEMSRMNYQVKVDKRSASEVAHEYLVNKGLVK